MTYQGFKATVCSCDSESLKTALKESISNVLGTSDSVEN